MSLPSLQVGFVGVSLVDWPGRVASSVYLPGCDLRCPFCHNPALVTGPFPPGPPLGLVGETLRQRAGFVDGVVVSGGEPTLFPQLGLLLASLKAAGLAIRLDSHGLHPQRLAPLVADGLLDALAIDLKTDPACYAELGAPTDAADRLSETFALAQAAGLELEVRSTCAPVFVSPQRLAAMARFVTEHGVRRWVLQRFRPEVTLDPSFADRLPPTRDELERALPPGTVVPEWRGFDPAAPRPVAPVPDHV